MPHQFKTSPDQPAVDYLVRLHADLGGQIQDNRAEALRLDQAMRHVEAVLKLFDPAFNVRRISARRKQKTNPWFKRGTLFREALGIMRNHPEGLTARQIADAVLKQAKIID